MVAETAGTGAVPMMLRSNPCCYVVERVSVAGRDRYISRYQVKSESPQIHPEQKMAGQEPSMVRICTFTMMLAAAALAGNTRDVMADDYLWLENVEGDDALAWVAQQNARSLPQIMAHPAYQQLYQNALEVHNSTARIPDITRRGDYLYNLWRDAIHVRGLYRRTTLAEYSKAEPVWETVLDLDKLAADEQQNWTWGGINCLAPDYSHCLISLSIAGSDAAVVREFNLAEKAFVAQGFVLPEAKSRVNWLDENAIIVGTD
ncbi:MAG: hypothetical protein KKD00_03745, partial [Gammaproteobacteria bacterium]|nr:hypothetical protein [Gammaproteobacteria bacterium]